MKKLLTCVATILLLSGCSSEKTEKLVCKVTSDNIEMSTTYKYSVGDESKLKTLDVETTTIFNDDDLKKASVEQWAEDTKKLYSEYEGIDYSYKSDDKQLTEDITVDLSKLTKESLQVLSIDLDPSAPFDLEQFKADMDTLGATCE